MNRLLALIALPFILGANLLLVSGKKKKEIQDIPIDLLSHTFKPEGLPESQSSFLIREPKF